ncbi:MAG: RNase adapter RapZ [Deltaproteobacteria bacterium]|nr:RNase adapter RapZ [Deltaproteobacteria bacterium]
MAIDLVILTGQSGSGKSTVLRTLEDHGYVCVDNLPVRLVERLIDEVVQEASVPRLVVVMDVRTSHFVAEAPALVGRLKAGPCRTRVLYLEASEAALVRRYSETRRRHPLDDGQGLRASITREREVLAPLRELADDTLDTSAMSPHDLRNRVTEQVAGVKPGDSLRVALLSFGFRHGVPLEADTVLDVRYLPNPYFDERLRPQSGQDAAVRSFVVDSEEGRLLVERADEFLGFLLQRYQREGRRYFTVAVGCTGGQHRSVAVAVTLAERMRARGIAVDLRHRDVHDGSTNRAAT